MQRNGYVRKDSGRQSVSDENVQGDDIVFDKQQFKFKVLSNECWPKNPKQQSCQEKDSVTLEDHEVFKWAITINF